MFGGGVGLEPRADLEAVHAGHHDVQQHDVRAAVAAKLQRFRPVGDGDDVEIFGGKARFEEFDIGKEIVDDQNTGGHVAGVPSLLSARKELTVSRNFATEMGLER